MTPRIADNNGFTLGGINGILGFDLGPGDGDPGDGDPGVELPLFFFAS